MIPDPLPPGHYFYLPAQALIYCLACGYPLCLASGYWQRVTGYTDGRGRRVPPRWRVVCSHCRGRAGTDGGPVRATLGRAP